MSSTPFIPSEECLAAGSNDCSWDESTWGGRDALVPAARPEVIDRINPRSCVNCAPLHVLRITDREFGVERTLKYRLRNC
jgi:hypothetical protein